MLTIESLLARSRAIAAPLQYIVQAAPFEEAARRCVAAGRADLAAALADGLPARIQGPALLIAAAAGAGSVDAALEAFERGSAVYPEERALWAAHAVEVVRPLAATSARAAELARLAEAVLGEASLSTPPWGKERRFLGLIPLLRALYVTGDTKPVRRLIELWSKEQPETIGEAVRDIRPLVGRGAEDPETALALIEAIGDHSRFLSLQHGEDLRACVNWPQAALVRLLALVPDMREQLARLLLAAKRDADARQLLQPTDEKHPPGIATLAERHQLLGDPATVKQLLLREGWDDERLVTRMQVEVGVESIAEARERLKQPRAATGGSVMSQVRMLVFLAELARERREHAEQGPILAEVDGLLASSQRTQYDRGVEGTHRNLRNDLRARIAADAGAPAVLAALTDDLAGLPALKPYGGDSHGKACIVTGFMQRAVRHGQPDLAMKAISQIPPAHRPVVAGETTRSFLPAYPAHALAALDLLVGPYADGMLLAHGRDGMLPQLWTGVLAAAENQPTS